MKRFLAAFTVIFIATTGAAFAGIGPAYYTLVPGTQGTETNTRAFGGLTWSLGAPAPEAVIGAFRTKVKPNGDTTGGNALVQIGFWNGIVLSKVKGQYMNGDEDSQAMGGAGWDFVNNQPFVTGGGNFRHFSAGVDVGFMNGFTFTPYGTVHTKGEFENNKTTGPQCVADPDGEFDNPTCTPSEEINPCDSDEPPAYCEG